MTNEQNNKLSILKVKRVELDRLSIEIARIILNYQTIFHPSFLNCILALVLLKSIDDTKTCKEATVDAEFYEQVKKHYTKLGLTKNSGWKKILELIRNNEDRHSILLELDSCLEFETFSELDDILKGVNFSYMGFHPKIISLFKEIITAINSFNLNSLGDNGICIITYIAKRTAKLLPKNIEQYNTTIIDFYKAKASVALKELDKF